MKNKLQNKIFRHLTNEDRIKTEEIPIGNFIIAKIRAGSSPETISGRLRLEIDQGLRPKKDFVTKETIYQFAAISSGMQQN